MESFSVSFAASACAGDVHCDEGAAVPHDPKRRFPRAALTLQSAGRRWWRSVLS